MNKKTKKDKDIVARPLFPDVVKKRREYNCMSIFELKTNNFDDELRRQNFVQKEVIHQVSKALEVCRSDLGYHGEDVMLEAEKILLVAMHKTDVLAKEIDKVDRKEMDNEPVIVSVLIRNLIFRINYEAYCRTSNNDNWYFICLVDAGKIVLSSVISQYNDIGNIIFADGFKFEELPSETEINISIYGINLTKNKKKKILCQIFRDRGNRSTSGISSVQSSFVLLGKATIRNDSLQSKSFKLFQQPLDSIVSDTVTLELDVFLKLNVSKSGFLSVGTTYRGVPIWTERWCVLEGSRLAYWNSPIEIDQAPIGEMDLLNCLNQLVLMADRNLCCRPRTLYLVLKVDNEYAVREYFLSADSFTEMQTWQRNLNAILKTLAEWNKDNCYLIN